MFDKLPGNFWNTDKSSSPESQSDVDILFPAERHSVEVGDIWTSNYHICLDWDQPGYLPCTAPVLRIGSRHLARLPRTVTWSRFQMENIKFKPLDWYTAWKPGLQEQISARRGRFLFVCFLYPLGSLGTRRQAENWMCWHSLVQADE